MGRKLKVAAAQMGPIDLSGKPSGSNLPSTAIQRMIQLVEQAARAQLDLVVFPELALTPFFPRWYWEDETLLDSFYEDCVPGDSTHDLFKVAKDLGIAIQLGYAERVVAATGARRYNSTVLVDKQGHVIGRYRKIHLPGDREPRVGAAFQHLEKRYFDVGDQGFPTWQAFGARVGSLICNDRRWPEAWRVLGLQGVELVLLGYNTPLHNPEAPELDRLVAFHHQLVLQSGCYQNGTWAIAAAKAGLEDGQAMLADSLIVSPFGEIVARSSTDGDELVMAEIDLDQTRTIKSTIFDFAAHRQVQAYAAIAREQSTLSTP